MDYNNNAFEMEAVEDDPTYVTTVSYQCQICAAHIKAKKPHKHPLKSAHGGGWKTRR